YVGVGKFAIGLKQFSTVNNIALGYDNSIYTVAATYYQSPAGTGTWTSLDPTTFHLAFVLRPNLNSTVGVPENDISRNIDVFPNPSNGKVYIHNGNANLSGFTVTVLNNLGEVV